MPLLLLLLLGCAHRSAAPDTAHEGDTAPAPSPCGAWSGVTRVGTRWTYAPSATYVEQWGYDGTYTVEVTAVEGGVVTLAESGAYTGRKGEFIWTRTDTWRCDADGAWLTASAATTHGTNGATTIDQVGERTFAPGWRIRPAEATDWTDTFTATIAVNGEDPRVSEVTCTTTLGPEETRTYAGLAMTTRAITPKCKGIRADPGWLGLGVGLLETADETLIAWEP